MQSARKVTLIPANDIQTFENSNNLQTGGGEEAGTIVSSVESDKIKSKIYDKIHRFIKIILKIARKVGYDDDLRIKVNGNYLDNTNIVDLLTHAMSPGKVLKGENDFIQLLAECNVDPELIINGNVRFKLIQHLNKNKNSKNYEDPNEVEIVETQPRRDELKFGGENVREVRKGNKKIIVVNAYKPIKQRKNIITVNKDGGEVNLEEMDARENLKRKRFDYEDESVEDDDIDSTRWEIR